VDTYLAQGRAAEVAAEAKRPTREERIAREIIESQTPRRKPGSTRIRFIPCGGPYVNDTTPQWWLDIKGKSMNARAAFAGDMIRLDSPPGHIPRTRGSYEPARAQELIEAGWTPC
jgi:hypothetical protein